MEVSMKKFGLLLLIGLLSLNLLQASNGKRPLESIESSSEPAQQKCRVQQDVREIHKELFNYVWHGNLQRVQELVAELRDRNENINPISQYGSGLTPLHFAVKQQQYDSNKQVYTNIVQCIVSALKAVGQDINPADREGRTPLHEAVLLGCLETVKILIAALKDTGKDINPAGSDGKTFLHYAAQFNNVGIVKFFFEAKKEDINLVDNDGRTSLHVAVLNRNAAVVQFLVEEAEADTSILDKDGKTASDLANDFLTGTECDHEANTKANREAIADILDKAFLNFPMK